MGLAEDVHRTLSLLLSSGWILSLRLASRNTDTHARTHAEGDGSEHADAVDDASSERDESIRTIELDSSRAENASTSSSAEDGDETSSSSMSATGETLTRMTSNATSWLGRAVLNSRRQATTWGFKLSTKVDQLKRRTSASSVRSDTSNEDEDEDATNASSSIVNATSAHVKRTAQSRSRLQEYREHLVRFDKSLTSFHVAVDALSSSYKTVVGVTDDGNDGEKVAEDTSGEEKDGGERKTTTRHDELAADVGRIRDETLKSALSDVDRALTALRKSDDARVEFVTAVKESSFVIQHRGEYGEDEVVKYRGIVESRQDQYETAYRDARTDANDVLSHKDDVLCGLFRAIRDAQTRYVNDMAATSTVTPGLDEVEDEDDEAELAM